MNGILLFIIYLLGAYTTYYVIRKLPARYSSDEDVEAIIALCWPLTIPLIIFLLCLFVLAIPFFIIKSKSKG